MKAKELAYLRLAAFKALDGWGTVSTPWTLDKKRKYADELVEWMLSPRDLSARGTGDAADREAADAVGGVTVPGSISPSPVQPVIITRLLDGTAK